MKNDLLFKWRIPRFLTILKWVAILIILYFSTKLDEPLMCKWRTLTVLLFLPLLMALTLRVYLSLMANCGSFLKRCERALVLAVLLSATATTLYDMAVFQYKKHVVLNASDVLLSKLGRHFIVGYRAPEDIVKLVRKRAIGGVYITSRNIRNKTVEAVRKELKSFQTIARQNSCPPLFIAADQEGGRVSRLSPLLDQMPSLSSIAGALSVDNPLDDRVKAYATTQAKQLADLGINLNLSPVVDLKRDRLSHKLNIRSRIDQRAISAHASTIADVAGIYCATFLNHGVRPTLKHFPGLGSVSEDTHISPGILDGSKDFLESNDWLPFRKIIAQTDPFIMLGHVHVTAVDPYLPASLSPAMITDMIRNEWEFEGILITDDFNMGAIAGRKEGIGKSAVRAINAGADLILLSYDGSQYYNAMYEMIEAYRKGALNRTVLSESSQRIFAYRPTEPSIAQDNRWEPFQ